MTRVGIIAGIGPESTIAYYRLIIETFQEEIGSDDYPEFTLHNISLKKMLSFVDANDLDGLVEFLKERIEILENSGVEYVALASNTPHLVVDQLRDKINLPIISIVEHTCRHISEKGLNRALLIGTKSTMSSGFYQQVANQYGIEIIVPNKGDQNIIHDKYVNEIMHNRVSAETKAQLLKMIQRNIRTKKIEGLILGGTELPLAIGQSDFQNLQIFNTTRIHVNSIVNRIKE